MLVTCGHCRVPEDREGLEALEGGFGFVCSGCGHPNILAPGVPRPAGALASAQAEAVEEAGVTCAKCGHHQGDVEACHRCGLVFAHVATGRARFSDPLEGQEDAEALQQRWLAIADRLEDEAGHHAFIELCATRNLLEYAGQCYRRLGGASEDARIARYRDRVIKAALARAGRLERRATESRKQFRNLLLLVLGALIVLAFALGYHLLSRYQLQWQGNG